MIQNMENTASGNYKIERAGLYFFRQTIRPLFETGFLIPLIHFC